MSEKNRDDFLDCLCSELRTHELIREEDIPKFLDTYFPELDGTPREIITNKKVEGIRLIQKMVESHDIGWLYQMQEVT